MIFKQETTISIDMHERRKLWLAINNWNKSYHKFGTHILPNEYRASVVIPNAKEIEKIINSLLTEAYKMGREDEKNGKSN